ncbi:MAG: YceI family protein [Conexibacteraceae bacterium]|nr:YceI family protein [Conexibacteraceae bacterium]
MSDEYEHDHEQGHDSPGHSEHDHDHDHNHDHDQDHALIVDRLPEGAWEVDHDGSAVQFKARGLFGLLPVAGVFERFSGDLTVGADGAAHGRLVVETASINTGIRRRDTDLRSRAYFDAANAPEMTFTLERLDPSGSDHLNAIGTLGIRQVTIPLSFPVQAIAHGDHLHLEGSVIVDHAAAGLRWAKPGMVTKTARAEVALTLTRAS